MPFNVHEGVLVCASYWQGFVGQKPYLRWHVQETENVGEI